MGAPATEAAKTSVCVARYTLSNPPHECPSVPTFAGSARPISTTFCTAGTTDSTTDTPGSRGRKTMSGWR